MVDTVMKATSRTEFRVHPENQRVFIHIGDLAFRFEREGSTGVKLTVFPSLGGTSKKLFSQEFSFQPARDYVLERSRTPIYEREHCLFDNGTTIQQNIPGDFIFESGVSEPPTLKLCK